MNLLTGNMFSYGATDAALVFVTANSTRRKDGCLVMGRGAAKELKDNFPGIDALAGALIEGVETYGIILLPYNLGLFQVKWHWKSPADYDLISYSTDKLDRFAREWIPGDIHLNFPGIGNGRRDRATVLSIIERLPDNVYVWELPE